MKFGNVKTVYTMLKKYGRRSVFSKGFALVFVCFFLLIMTAFFATQYFSDSAKDNSEVKSLVKELYSSRNRLDGIISTVKDMSRAIEADEGVIGFVDGSEDGERALLRLTDEKNYSGFTNSIYLLDLNKDYIVSTSGIYKSAGVGEFADVSWMDMYRAGYDLFYREYPDMGLLQKCISYCHGFETENGGSAVIVYNVNYVKANLNSSEFEKGKFIIVNDKSEVLYSADSDMIGKAAEEVMDFIPTGSDTDTYVRRHNRKDSIVLAVKLKKSNVKLMFEMEKAYMENPYLQPVFLTVFIIMSLLLALLAALLMTTGIYRPLTGVLSLINSTDKYMTTGKNEINDTMEYIIALNNKKELAESELTQKVMLLQHAQVIALQSQLNPHFLFNTLQLLNSVILAEFKKDTEATKIVSILSGLLREALDTTEFFRSLEDEVKFAKRYIEIQNIRYPDCFVINWSIAEETKKMKVPKCILQPLLENSIAYGILVSEEKGVIDVTTAEKDGLFKISVRDNGVGIDEEELKRLRRAINDKKVERKDKIGLCNINQRIKILFGVEYGIEIFSENGTEVVVTLPAG